MFAAIGYAHYMGISHRDLKLENFIFESKDEASDVKLIDFGLSSKYGSSLRRMHTMVGTPYYIAPEVLNQAETGNRGYTHACDCWSLGVIAYMLVRRTVLCHPTCAFADAPGSLRDDDDRCSNSSFPRPLSNAAVRNSSIQGQAGPRSACRCQAREVHAIGAEVGSSF